MAREPWRVANTTDPTALFDVRVVDRSVYALVVPLIAVRIVSHAIYIRVTGGERG